MVSLPRRVLAVYFFLTGTLFALWGATLAATDARLGLGPGRLGTVLLAMSLAAIATVPLAGRAAARWGSCRTVRTAAPAAAVAMAGPALAWDHLSLLAAAVVLGAMSGAMNVVLGLRAVETERATGRPLMGRMQGLWTLGSVAGAGAVTIAFHLGAGARAVLVAGGLLLAALYIAVAGPGGGRASAVAPPPVTAGTGRGVRLVVLGVIGASAFVVEGAAADWAGVHAATVLGASPAAASLAYTVFCVAMTGVRFAGDALRARLGAARTVRAAGATAIGGLTLVLASPALGTPAALIGWAVAGAGVAMVWPVVASAAGDEGGLPRVSAIGYGGGLAGPALIGGLAEAATLPVALLLPAALAVLIALAAPPVLRPGRSGLPGVEAAHAAV
ncbi:MFS transporter [Actinorhabdospora filicis]|uniref:MFS transporter n=1 Tax=Actinorhabdospora filicis TaxID=1785913 RepID=A0A9W6SMD1_9ACTN|nr:MFS transporter [Actinorhabdospora filicis]GLZ78567.1 MFS transporter [Actinorhabdospora filicis]